MIIRLYYYYGQVMAVYLNYSLLGLIMAKNTNTFILTGHLVDDPEFTAGATAEKDRVKFRIACNRNDERADFFPITVFGKIASNHADNLAKGSRVLVEGAMSNNDYESNGVKHYSFNFVADRVEYLSAKRSAPGGAE